MGDSSRKISDTTASTILDTLADLPKFVEEVLSVTAHELSEIIEKAKGAPADSLPKLELEGSSEPGDKAGDQSANATDGQAKTEVDMAKIRQTSREIAEKANEDLITKDQFNEVIEQFPDKSSRSLALEIMEQSAPNLTRRGVDQQLSGVLSQIEATGAKKITIAVLGESTSGKALSYLARLNTK